MEKLAEWLGAKSFKKYWPVGGSYWNRLTKQPKLNPNNRSDLERTIKEAYEYTQRHVQALTVESIILLPCIFLAKDVQTETIYTYVSLTGIHLYALIIHYYNRILARRRLDSIKNIPEVEPNKIDPYQLQIINLGNAEAWFRLGFIYQTFREPIYLGPYFTSREKAEKYKESLKQKVDSSNDSGEKAIDYLNNA